jgi:hypothetical protein
MRAALTVVAIQDFDVHSCPTAAYLHIVPTQSKDKARPSSRSSLSRSPVVQRKVSAHRIPSGTPAAAFPGKMAPALAPSHSNTPMRRPLSAPAPKDKLTGQTRPSALKLILTHGLTTLSTSELKRQIRDARPADPSSTVVQIPTDKRSGWNIPPTPFTPRAMGNRASRPSGNIHFNSGHDIQRDPKWRRSSQTADRLERVDHIRRQNSTLNTRDAYRQVEYPRAPRQFPRNGNGRNPASGSAATQRNIYATSPRNIGPVHATPLLRSRSDIDLTQKHALQPSRSVSTLRRTTSATSTQTSTDGLRLDGSFEPARPTSGSDRRNQINPISPVIPAPTPLPEDSPHKYGLLDNTDTSIVAEPTMEKTASRARRRSSGLEIFQVMHPIHLSSGTKLTKHRTPKHYNQRLPS